MPTARSALGAVRTSGLIYAFGGEAQAGIVDTVEAYDLATNTWHLGAP
jgi:hypothetical protein